MPAELLYEIHEVYTPYDAENDRIRQSFRFKAEDLFDENDAPKSADVLWAVIKAALRATGCNEDNAEYHLNDIKGDEEPSELLDSAAEHGTFTVAGCGNNGEYEWEIILDPVDKPGRVSFDQGAYINKLADSLRGDNHLYTALVSIKSKADFGRASAILRDVLHPDQFRVVSAVFQIVANVGGEHDKYPPSPTPQQEAPKTDA